MKAAIPMSSRRSLLARVVCWLAAGFFACGNAFAGVPLESSVVARSLQIKGSRASQSKGASLAIVFENRTDKPLKLDGSDYIPAFEVSRPNGQPVEKLCSVTRCWVPDPFVLSAKAKLTRRYDVDVWEGYEPIDGDHHAALNGRYRVAARGTKYSWLLTWAR